MKVQVNSVRGPSGEYGSGMIVWLCAWHMSSPRDVHPFDSASVVCLPQYIFNSLYLFTQNNPRIGFIWTIFMFKIYQRTHTWFALGPVSDVTLLGCVSRHWIIVIRVTGHNANSSEICEMSLSGFPMTCELNIVLLCAYVTCCCLTFWNEHVDMISSEKIKTISVNTLHTLSHIWLSSTAVTWKLIWLLLDRPLLIDVYWTTVKYIWLVRPVLRKLIFCICAPSACSVILLKIPQMQFYLGMWSLQSSKI